jgi:hypothetical protein
MSKIPSNFVKIHYEFLILTKSKRRFYNFSLIEWLTGCLLAAILPFAKWIKKRNLIQNIVHLEQSYQSEFDCRFEIITCQKLYLNLPSMLIKKVDGNGLDVIW